MSQSEFQTSGGECFKGLGSSASKPRMCVEKNALDEDLNKN
ncbi:hypothetical protein Hanom_Chr09g00800961 [Helianthus anomalus]